MANQEISDKDFEEILQELSLKYNTYLTLASLADQNSQETLTPQTPNWNSPLTIIINSEYQHAGME